MNEVTRIHLGRQPFTIAIDARKALEAYLADIKKQIGSKGAEVIKEVELRMAELLAEHGISGDKVILMEDITFLKDQLGDPGDFKDDDSEASQKAEPEGATTKRFFRDTEHGMVAGVAAGLASYFGIDLLLVRIIILITIIAGGWGILLYVALWWLVPDAKSPSDRLQMQGKAVTVESLKQAVERADLQSTAQRAGTAMGSWINSAFLLIIKVIGLTLIISALFAICGLIAASIYMWLHQGNIFQEGFFPVGTNEHILVIIGLVWAGLAALFVVLFGMAMVRDDRKWPIGSWPTGVLLGLLFIGLAAVIALAGDTAPKVRDRYNAAHHSITRPVQPFNAIDIQGGRGVRVEHGDTYAVRLGYIGNPDISQIKTNVINNKLVVESSQLPNRPDCNLICLFPDYNVELTIITPMTPDFSSQFIEN